MHRSLASWIWVLSLTLIVSGGRCCWCEELADDPISWITKYNEARRQGIEQNRPVLLFLTSDHCSFCERMRSESFSNDQIVRDIQSRFVPAQLHLKMDDQLAKDLMVRIYPTTIFIAPDGKIIDYARGYLSENELHRRMLNAVGSQNSIASRE